MDALSLVFGMDHMDAGRNTSDLGYLLFERKPEAFLLRGMQVSPSNDCRSAMNSLSWPDTITLWMTGEPRYAWERPFEASFGHLGPIMFRIESQPRGYLIRTLTQSNRFSATNPTLTLDASNRKATHCSWPCTFRLHTHVDP